MGAIETGSLRISRLLYHALRNSTFLRYRPDSSAFASEMLKQLIRKGSTNQTAFESAIVPLVWEAAIAEVFQSAGSKDVKARQRSLMYEVAQLAINHAILQVAPAWPSG